MKRAAVLSFSDRGADTARRVKDALGGAWETELFAPRGDLKEKTAALFPTVDALIFVGACGIAVRAVAPHVVSKTSDPAVLVLDERGRFVISLLSGHIGGGNALTETLAAALSAVPVVTTATDVNGRFSVDAWAARQGLLIESMETAKRYSAAVLMEDLPFVSDLPIVGSPPPGTFPGESGALGFAVTARDIRPFAETLRLIPPVLHVGIGCKRGTPAERIRAAVEEAFRESGLLFPAVTALASIDVKADETGLLAFARETGREIRFFTADQLRNAPGEFSASAFVANAVGVDNVCERAAVLSAGDGAELLVRKIGRNGVTVAVAREKRRICFE